MVSGKLSVRFSTGIPGFVSTVAVTFTITAPVSNLAKASSKHATHSNSVWLTKPVVLPGGPCGPTGPCVPLAPGGPCGPIGPCGPVLLSLTSFLSLCFLSSNFFASQNSTELTKKPSNGPVLHSYFLSLVL